MARHGGARNRSGPQPDPKSLRSSKRDIKLDALPSAGYDGAVPEFPLPLMKRYRWEHEDKRRYQVFDDEATEQYRERELAVWAELWVTPQAAAWSIEPWRWSTVAEFCRLKAVVEQEPDGVAALVAHLHRYRDQIGLSPAGLKENGWTIASGPTAADDDDRKPGGQADVVEMFRRRGRGA